MVSDDKRLNWYCDEILKRTDGSGAISCLEFNDEGTHLAYGNGNGIVSIVELSKESSDSFPSSYVSSKSYQTFVSHEAEFDKLKSLPIEARIQYIRWLPKAGRSHRLLSANERTIKLWRLSDSPAQTVKNLNFPPDRGSRQKMIIRSREDIKVPSCEGDPDNMVGRIVGARTYDKGHDYGLTGLSMLSDQENFLSADPLRINLWNLEVTGEVYSIIDNPFAECTTLSHLINCMATSSSGPSLFAYGSNRGSSFIQDLRQKVDFHHAAVVFDSLPSTESDMLKIYTSGISDITFGHLNNRYVFTRDYLVVKVWDSTMPSTPVEVYPVQSELFDMLNPSRHLPRFMEDFHLSVSSDDRFIVTGSYKNLVHVFDRRQAQWTNVSKSDYRLVMPDEFQISSQLARCFAEPQLAGSPPSSASSSEQLTWPRPVPSETNDAVKESSVLSTDAFTNLNYDPMLSLDNARCWLQAAWRPKSMLFATAHSDAIHLIQPTDFDLVH